MNAVKEPSNIYRLGNNKFSIFLIIDIGKKSSFSSPQKISLIEHQIVKRAGEHVAGLKHNRNTSDGRPIFGVYKGVRVGVIRTKGRISTIFPDSDQSPVIKKGGNKA